MDDKNQLYLIDILESIKYIEEYSINKTDPHMLEDTYWQDAVIRRLGIIGEAATKLSDELKEAFPEVPWKEMVSMRNKLIHEYSGIDLIVLIQTVREDIPALKNSIENIIQTSKA